MGRSVIISCALTGGAPTVGKNPAVPVTPEQIAQSGIDAAAAGAAIVHVHVRDPKTGRSSMEFALYREVVERIRASGSDVVINLTTGPGSMVDAGALVAGAASNHPPAISSPDERVVHIRELQPEICSLDMGSMNFGDMIFANSPRHLGEMARAIKSTRTRPELEVFDAGHIALSRHLIERGDIAAPALFQLCLGIPWGAPATPASMTHMQSLLPEGSPWAAFGIGSQQFPMVAQAVLLGGHVRVGLEDNLYLEKGVLAPSNAALVEKAVKILHLLGTEPASAAEARHMLQLNR